MVDYSTWFFVWVCSAVVVQILNLPRRVKDLRRKSFARDEETRTIPINYDAGAACDQQV